VAIRLAKLNDSELDVSKAILAREWVCWWGNGTGSNDYVNKQWATLYYYD
jgi:hypothetical protein